MFRQITIIFLVIAWASVALAAGKARTWTSSDGRTMEAEFVRELDGDVTFLKDGKLIVIRLEKLSEKDQQAIKDIAAGKEPEQDPFSGPAEGNIPEKSEKADPGPAKSNKPIAIQTRTWTDRFGVKSSGKFVRVDGNNVVINRGTRVITVPFENLSDGDQKYVREVLISQGKESEIPTGSQGDNRGGGAGVPAGRGPNVGRGPGMPGVPAGVGPGGGLGGVMPPALTPPGGGMGPGVPGPGAMPKIPGTGAGGMVGMPSTDTIPGMPGMPGMPGSGAMPKIPGAGAGGMAGMPSTGTMPGMPGTPGMPGSGAMPKIPGAGAGGMAGMPSTGTMPGMPGTPGMPGAGSMPGAGAMPGANSIASSGFGSGPSMPSIPSGPSIQFEEVFECSKCGARLTKAESTGTSCPRCNATWGFKQDQFGNKTLTTAGRGQISSVAGIIVIFVLLGMVLFIALFIGVIVAIVKAVNRPQQPQQMHQQRYY